MFCSSVSDTMKLLLLILTIGLLMGMASLSYAPKMFSSKEEMEKMVETEKTLFQVLDNYTIHLEERARKLKEFHEEFKEAFEEASNGIEDYLNNPVNAFIFARRLLITWKEVENIMKGDVGKEWIRELKVTRLLNGLALPTKEDMAYAANQVKKLQDQYHLNATSMADGGAYGILLNSGDCFELGREAYEEEDFEHAYDWLQEALKRIGDGRAKETDILEYLAAVAYLKGRVRQAHSLTKRFLELSPKHSKGLNNIKFYERKLKEISENKQKAVKKDIIVDLLNWHEEDIDDLVNKLCDGELTLGKRVLSKLKCRLAHKDDAFLRLARLKEEDAYLNPEIRLYHDVLSGADILALQNSASKGLYPLKADGLSGASVVQLPDNTHLSVATASRRASYVSGFDVTYSDMLQISRFDKNGGYRPHLDVQEIGIPIVRKAGNKLATVQYFLDDAGGATVFPALKLAVRAPKGSALVWSNLKKNGLGDDLTLHGTCTIKEDNHWEAIKWVRAFGNEFNRPCDLSPSI